MLYEVITHLPAARLEGAADEQGAGERRTAPEQARRIRFCPLLLEGEAVHRVGSRAVGQPLQQPRPGEADPGRRRAGVV